MYWDTWLAERRTRLQTKRRIDEKWVEVLGPIREAYGQAQGVHKATILAEVVRYVTGR